MAEARRAIGLSEEEEAGVRVDVAEYFGCVDQARLITGDDDDDDGMAAQENSPGIALVRFYGRHGLERDGWRGHEEL